MTHTAYDGTVRQAGLAHTATRLTGIVPQFSSIGLRQMVVTHVVYSDQPGNRSRTHTEYICRDLLTGEDVPHCQSLASLGGIDDGDDSTLAPATQIRTGAQSTQFTGQTVARDTDGTMVLVGFIEGSKDRPVIVGALKHSVTSYAAKAADGQRRLTTHKGTSVEFKADGTYTILRKNGSETLASVTVQPNGDVAVTHHSGAHLTITPTNVTVHHNDTINLGDGAADAAVLGTKMNSTVIQPAVSAAVSLEVALVSALATLSPDLVLGTPTGATVASLSALLSGLLTYAKTVETALANFPSALSAKVVIE